MSTHQPVLRSAAAALLPVAMLAFIDSFILCLTSYSQSLSHFFIAFFSTQLLCALVFAKGEICPGQRGRLVQCNLYLLAFWGFSLVASWYFDNLAMGAIGLIGLLAQLCLLQHYRSGEAQNTILVLAVLISLIGMLLSTVPMFALSNALLYQFFIQLLIGVILVALALNISRNRLQGFIALLPHIMLLCLAASAIFSAILLTIAYSNAVIFQNEFALLLYFALHFVLATILIWHIWHKQKPSYFSLIFLLFIAASLPLWMQFSFLSN